MSEGEILAIAIATILFLCFLGVFLAIKKNREIESNQEWESPRIRAERPSSIPDSNSNAHEEWDIWDTRPTPMIRRIGAWEWSPRPGIRSLDLERASPIPVITSNSHQETPTDAASSSRIPGQQPSQQSLRVNLPPEIILSPSQHIINQKCDRPPSYESLFPT